MSLTINTNTAAISAAFNLAKNNEMLNKSLNRLSSGKRITKPSDDAGGLAISMKLSSSIARSRAAKSNIQNAQSVLSIVEAGQQKSIELLQNMREKMMNNSINAGDKIRIVTHTNENARIQIDQCVPGCPKKNFLELLSIPTISKPFFEKK